MISEVNATLQRLCNEKAPGHDNISTEELKAVTEGTGMPILLAFLHSIWIKKQVDCRLEESCY